VAKKKKKVKTPSRGVGGPLGKCPLRLRGGKRNLGSLVLRKAVGEIRKTEQKKGRALMGFQSPKRVPPAKLEQRGLSD